MKRPVQLLIILVLLSAVTIVADENRSDSVVTMRQYILHLCGDSVWYRVGEYSGSTPADYSSGRIDTSNIHANEDFILYSETDTVIIKPSSAPVELLTVCPPDTGIEIVIFHLDDDATYIKKYQEKVEVLRRYPDFGNTPPEDYKTFTYSAPDDSDLIKLREEYKLDSVAGDGGEIERITNLLHWASNIVRHEDRMLENVPRNALDLIASCVKENRGVNCRMKATILNEAYLAMGFKSRHVTCMPADTADRDCHVINMVYSDSLGKWLNMDPSFDACFMDSARNILSIAEIRQMMINGDSLILNDELNYNGGSRSVLRHKSYIAKNLFRFSCPLESEFGYETLENELQIQIYLNPLGYDEKYVGKTYQYGNENNKLIKYFTDNSEYFWAAPY